MPVTTADLDTLDDHLARTFARELRHRGEASHEWVVSVILALFHRRDELAAQSRRNHAQTRR